MPAPSDESPGGQPDGDSTDGTADASDEPGPSETPDAPQSDGDVSAYITDERTLSASVQFIWALRALAGVAILGVVALFLAGRLSIDPSLVVGGIVVLVPLVLVWVHLRYRIWSFRVREDALYLERGVVTHVRTVAPYVRIQHVDTQRGPLERALGLSTLVVYTAGSRGADVSIPGLTTDEAADLQARVKELAIEAEGGDAL